MPDIINVINEHLKNRSPSEVFLIAEWMLKDSLSRNEYYGAQTWINEIIKSLYKLRTESSYQDYLMR